MHSECDFLSEILVVYLIQKAQEKIIERSSMLLCIGDQKFVCVIIWASADLVYALKSKVTESVYRNFASFVVSFHGWFVVPESNFQFSSDRANILEITFYAVY